MAADAVWQNLADYPTQYKVNAAAALGIPVSTDLGNFDFTGLGNAQTAGVVSDQMAQTLLKIQQNYAPDFIKSQLAQLKAADPQGYAARQQLFDAILQQANEQPNRPIATDLQQQINQTLTDAGHLTDRQLQEVQQNVRGGQVARGNYLGNAATGQEASAAVSAEDQNRTAAQSQALQFLESGVSPQDVAYRRLQQSLGNLSNFVQGQTPTAEFSTLSSAGNAAAPTNTGFTNPSQVDTNAPAFGANQALQIYGGQINWAQQQVNPYLAGLSTAATGLGTAASLGWQPWQTTVPGTPGLTPSQVALGNTPPNWNPQAPG